MVAYIVFRSDTYMKGYLPEYTKKSHKNHRRSIEKHFGVTAKKEDLDEKFHSFHQSVVFPRFARSMTP